MQNRVYVICMYVCMDGMYASQMRARKGFFPPKNTAFQA